MRMSAEMKQQQKDAIKMLTIKDIDSLLADQFVDPDEVAVFTNVEVAINGVPTIITLKVTKDGESIHNQVYNLPDGLGAGIREAASVTQAQRGFHEQAMTQAVFKQVFDSLKEKFQEHIFLLQPEFFDILALAAMSSYFREAFHTYPFIDFHANDLECGKTTAMKAFTWSCYNGVIQTIPTPAVIYRKIHQSKGVLGLDELEDTLRNRESAGFIKGILDAAHTKGIPAERCDPNDPSRLQTFDAFGIKVFSRVGGIPSSIVSRSIRIPMIQAPKETKLKKLRTAYTFDSERNKMYAARIQYSFEVLEASQWVEENCGLTHRPADLFIPILTMAKMVSKKQYEATLKWSKKFVEDRRGTYEDEWNQALVEICLNHIGEDISQKEIRDEWIEMLHTRDLLSGREPRSVTKRLEGLSLARTEKTTNRQIHFFMDKDIVYAWCRRYRIPLPENEHEDFLNGVPLDSPDDSELAKWVRSKPESEKFILSMKEYNEYGAEALRRGLIRKSGASEYRRRRQ